MEEQDKNVNCTFSRSMATITQDEDDSGRVHQPNAGKLFGFTGITGGSAHQIASVRAIVKGKALVLD